MIEASIRKRAIKVADLPDWLGGALKKVSDLAEDIRNSDEWGALSGAMKAILDQRKVISGEILALAAERAATRFDEGYVATNRAEDDAAKAEAFRKKAEAASSTAEKGAVDAQASAQLAAEAKKLSEANARATEAASTKASEARKEAEDHRTATIKSRKVAQGAADHAVTMGRRADSTASIIDLLLWNEREEVEAQKLRRAEIEKQLTDTSTRAHKVFFQATTAALAVEWQSKRKAAQGIMTAWMIALLFSVSLAVASSLFMAVPELFHSFLPREFFDHLSRPNATFERQLLTKLFIVPPLIFAVWFSASQYTHARDRQQEYAKRETVAKTLDSYREFLTDLAGDDDKKIDEVFKLFTTSIANLWAFVLSDSHEAGGVSFSIFKKREASTEDVLELLTKLKSVDPKLLKLGEG